MKTKTSVLALSAVAALAFGIGEGAAQSLVDRQQQEMRQLKQTWERHVIPAGIQKTAVRPTTVRDSGTDSVSLQVQDVNFNFVGDIGFHVIDLAVSLEPVQPGDPVSFDDPRKFRIVVQRGQVVVPKKALDALFNQHILDYFPKPLHDMDIATSEDYLEADAGLLLWSWFPGFPLPAHLGGTLALDDKNWLVYTPDDVRALGIPLAGLLSALGIPLDLLLSIDREGAKLVGSQLELDPRTVFPPPEIVGNVAAAKLTEAGLVLDFADNPDAQFQKPPLARKSYIWIQSGDPKLFDIVVTNARVQVVPKGEEQRLTFNLYDYRKQVAAGVLQMSGDGTIVATIPSYEEIAGVAPMGEEEGEGEAPVMTEEPAAAEEPAEGEE
jgi:hypothetical protein